MAHYRIDRAAEFIASAEVLLAAGHPNAAVSRAYYAIYHLAVLCLVQFGRFEERDVGAWKHKTVVGTFIKTFSQRGFYFNVRDGDVLHQLWREREDADYHEKPIHPTQGVRSVAAARSFHGRMLRELGADS